LKTRIEAEQRIGGGQGTERLIDDYIRNGGDRHSILLPDAAARPRTVDAPRIPGEVKNEIQRLVQLSNDELFDLAIRYGLAETAVRDKTPGQQLEEAWSRYQRDKGLPKTPDEGVERATYIFTPQQLAGSQQLVNQLWQIAEAGFGDKNDRALGKYHPVSMQEARETFEALLLSEQTYTTVHFKDGKPFCFGTFTFNMENCDWLNTQNGSFAREVELAKQRGETPVYFFDVIGLSDDGSAMQVFGLSSQMATANAMSPRRLLFETTNFSADYIPLMVNYLFRPANGDTRIINQEGRVVLIDQLNYRLATVRKKRKPLLKSS